MITFAKVSQAFSDGWGGWTCTDFTPLPYAYAHTHTNTCTHTRTHPGSVEVSSFGDGPSPRQWVLTGVTTKNHLGQPESLWKKLQKLSVHGATQREGEMRATSEETRPLQRRITVLEGRVREAERGADEERRKREEAEQRAGERIMELEHAL